MKQQIENAFTYHAPQLHQVPKYTMIRNAAKDFANMLNELCPNSREKSTAISRLEEVVMWSNAAIARTPDPQPKDFAPNAHATKKTETISGAEDGQKTVNMTFKGVAPDLAEAIAQSVTAILNDVDNGKFNKRG